jgi:hypothetical protein
MEADEDMEAGERLDKFIKEHGLSGDILSAMFPPEVYDDAETLGELESEYGIDVVAMAKKMATTINSGECYFTHNSVSIDTNGTHLQGHLDISYENIVKAFGEPENRCVDKSDWEWRIQFSNDVIATIYNWKNGPNYGVMVKPEEVWEWNMGGHTREAAEMIRAVFLTNGVLI